jgi:hypothetical protein
MPSGASNWVDTSGTLGSRAGGHQGSQRCLRTVSEFLISKSREKVLHVVSGALTKPSLENQAQSVGCRKAEPIDWESSRGLQDWRHSGHG